jgi:hypothetical protein
LSSPAADERDPRHVLVLGAGGKDPAWRPRCATRGCWGLRLILAARSDPLLPLHRYRLAGQMHELRASDLAMTPAEVTGVLAIHGVTLPACDSPSRSPSAS